ncbi:hypothetical protein SAMN05421664_3537 [Chryseobacterium soldanellicola]|uniref:Uncharacterized protein n=1 Tax=Chryseobacterium soldanellicola TaxID=311333 RepID=A0A1H1G9K2_9FLAO|nr:hypothetical protein [Chryseobacterium soldanellicola]SDR09871.1 hypothetical protein SAMN05421664_3537 [Chryseobacterium soldanellicola]
MKNIITLFALAICLINCKAQQIYPLNTFYKNAPNYSYMKDLDNLLPPYIGIYKANYDGNEITLYITKEDKVLNDRITRQFYRDALRVKYIVKKISTGIILQDTQNIINTKNRILSIGTNILDNNSIALIYSGTNCGIGYGRITLKKISNTQINWSYYPDSRLLSDGDCPGNPDIKIYLPDTENLVFTKQ